MFCLRPVNLTPATHEGVSSTEAWARQPQTSRGHCPAVRAGTVTPEHSQQLSHDCHLGNLPHNQALGCHGSSWLVERTFYFVACPGSVCEMMLVLLLGLLDASRFPSLGSLLGCGAGRQELAGLGCLAPRGRGFCQHFSLCLRLD